MSFVIREALAADQPVATTAAVDAVPSQLSPEKMMTDNMLLLGAIFFIFYFLLIRPQQKRVKMHQALIDNIKKGDRIITSGGLMGTITKLEGTDVVVVEIAQGVKVRVSRVSVSEVVTSPIPSDSANDN